MHAASYKFEHGGRGGGGAWPLINQHTKKNYGGNVLTRSIRDSETSIDFVQGPPGSRRERVNSVNKDASKFEVL